MWRAIFAAWAVLLLPVPLVAAVVPAGPVIPVSANTISDHCCPRVAAFSDGGFVVTWLASPVAGGKTTIHARLFGADGTPASGEFRLLPPSRLYQRLDALATDRDGTLLVAWHENGGPGDYEPFPTYFRRLDRDGSTIGPRRVLETRSAALFPADPIAAIAIRADGLFAVAWTACDDSVPNRPCDFFDSVAQVFRADGSPARPRFLVEQGDDIPTDDPLSSIPTAMVWNPDGTLTIAFHDYADSVRYHASIQRFTVGGRARSEPIWLSTASYRCPSSAADLAAVPSGGVLAVFRLEPCSTFEWSVQSRRFTSTLASSLPMSEVDDGQFSSGAPHLAVMPDGGYVVIWESAETEDSRTILGRSFAADSTLLRQFQIARTTASHQLGPVIAATQDGGAVVAWVERSTGASGVILARLLRQR